MFSQRAQEVFAHVNQGGINRQWDAVQILKSLGKDVESEQERDALEMLAGAISMSFNKKKQSFTPLFERRYSHYKRSNAVFFSAIHSCPTGSYTMAYY